MDCKTKNKNPIGGKMTQFTETIGRTAWEVSLNFPGAAAKDVKIQSIEVAGEPKQVIVTCPVNATMKKLGYTQNEFEFVLAQKFDVKNLKSNWNNGILNITVGLDEGVAHTHEVK